MTVILQAMRAARGDPSRNEVIVPAYTCYSVPAAIERAGLQPRLCDIDPATLGMDPEALDRCDFSRTLAVISANLYGLPNALGEIEAVCRRRSVFLLDDAAQALGAKLDGRAAGSFGDAGLYSFDKGKIISTIQGGAVVCRQSDLTAHLEAALAKLPQRHVSGVIGQPAEAGRSIRSSCAPSLYGVIRWLPFTGLGHTRYETRYPVTALTRWQAGVAARLLERLPELNGRRRTLAARLPGRAGRRAGNRNRAIACRAPNRHLRAIHSACANRKPGTGSWRRWTAPASAPRPAIRCRSPTCRKSSPGFRLQTAVAMVRAGSRGPSSPCRPMRSARWILRIAREGR